MKAAVPGAEVGGEDEDFGLFVIWEKYRWTAHIGYKPGILHAEGKGEMVQAAVAVVAVAVAVAVGDCFFGRLNSLMVVQVCWKGCQARIKEAISWRLN